MNEIEINLDLFSKTKNSQQWVENESIVKGVFFTANSAQVSQPDSRFKVLKAPTLDGNELWLVEESECAKLEAMKGFHKPLPVVFELTAQEMKEILKK